MRKGSVAYWVSRDDGKFELEWYKKELASYLLQDIREDDSWEYIKPLLRPMSSMTEEEAEEMFHLMYPNDKLLKVELEQDRVRFNRIFDGKHFGVLTLFFNKIYSLEQLDWYYSKHFDVRDLIGKNLAIEVTDKNNPYERID